MDGNGRFYRGLDGNPSVAIDNNTWAAHVFIPYDVDLVRSSARFVERRFVVGHPPAEIESALTGASSEGLEGTFFFTSSFADPFVHVPLEFRAKLERIFHPEATFGYILMLRDLSDALPGLEGDRIGVRAYELLDKTIRFIQLYGPNSAPYASAYIPEIFTTMDSVPTAATGVVAASILDGTARNGDFIGVLPPPEFVVDGRRPRFIAHH